jgi:GT2 family glycosyltransferase
MGRAPLNPAADRPTTGTMSVSIVAVLDGAPQRALRCLSALASVPDDPRHEVVLVDDASVGLEELFARVEGDATVVRTEARAGAAVALGRGAAIARGDIVVLIRDAAEVTPSFLRPLVDTLARDPRVAAAVSACGGVPVTAHAIAVRRTDLHAIGGTPAAPDGLEGAALVAALARLGRVEEVAASVVQPPGSRTVGLRHTPGVAPELTIVIPTLDAASERVRRCVAAVQRTTEAPHEIVIVDNGAPPQGFTAPVNAGLRAARTPYAVVMNDDVEPLPGWWAPLRDALDAGATVAFPMTIDGAMRTDFAAWCFGVSRATIADFSVAEGEFFDPDLVVWYQDTDLLQRLRLAGRPPMLVADARIRHGLSETVATEDPALRAWLDRQVMADKHAFERKHGAAVQGAAR